MAAKLTKALRRHKSVTILTAALAGSAIAVAGCGGDSGSGASAGEAASYVPAASPLYLEVTTDLDGAQWTQVEALAKQFPGYPDVERMIRQELSAEDVDFENEIRPLLGERAAVAALELPDTGELQGGLTTTAPDAGAAADAVDDAPFVAVVQLADGAAPRMKELLVREGARETGERAGATLYEQAGEDGVVAVDDEAVVFSGTQQNVVASLDAHAAGGDQTLGGTDRFTDALSKLPPDVFGQAYLDIGAIVQQAGAAAGPQAEQLGLADYRDAVMAASIAAEPEGARMKGVVLGAPAGVSPAEFTPQLTDTVPADALAYVGFSDLAGSLTQVLQQVQGSLGDAERNQLEGLSGQLPQLLGVTLDDLSALAEQEHALVVTPGATPGAALALEVEDGAAAQATLDKLRTGLPGLVRTFSPDTQIPAWTRVPLVGGVEGWRLPLSPEAGVVYGVEGDMAVIGTSAKAVSSVMRPVAPLSESAAYQAGTAGMPDQVTSVTWINLEDGIAALRNMGAFEDTPPEALANLAPLKSIAAWTTAGDTPTFEIFARIKG